MRCSTRKCRAEDGHARSVLGFNPQNLKNDGKFHALKIELKQPSGYTLQATMLRNPAALTSRVRFAIGLTFPHKTLATAKGILLTFVEVEGNLRIRF